jgi:GBP family porin
MKKTLLAAALLTGGFAGTAMAQNSVTLYGRLQPNLIFDQVKVPTAIANAINENTASANPARAGTFNQLGMADGYFPGGSLWGIRGVEDLGGGLKAGFMFESGFSTVDGSGSNRRASLGLSNDAWGEVKVGKDFAPSDTLLAGISPMGTGMGVGGANRAFGVFTQNYGSMVSYLSPSFAGFRIGAAYAFQGVTVRGVDDAFKPFAGKSERFGTMSKNRAINLSARYSNGPILLAGSYIQYNPSENSFSTSPKNWLLGGAYDLKVVRLHAAYGQNIDGLIGGQFNSGAIGGESGANFGLVGGGAIAQKGARTNQWMAGATAPLGASGRLLFSVSQQRPGGTFVSDITATMTNVAVAYEYRFSQRTSAQVSYSYANNLFMLEGVKSNQVGLGIVHNF